MTNTVTQSSLKLKGGSVGVLLVLSQVTMNLSAQQFVYLIGQKTSIHRAVFLSEDSRKESILSVIQVVGSICFLVVVGLGSLQAKSQPQPLAVTPLLSSWLSPSPFKAGRGGPSPHIFSLSTSAKKDS